MAVNNLLNSVLLQSGVTSESDEVVIPESSERVNLRLLSVQVGSVSSQARLLCVDAEGRVKKTAVVNGSQTVEVEVEAITGAITCSVTCSLGSCRVTLDELTGIEGSTGEGSGGLSAADIADGSITAPKLAALAVTTAKLAPLSVTDAELAALAVTTGKLAALAVTDAELAALAVTTAKIAAGALSADAAGRGKIADDYFTPAEFIAGAGGKFAADCMDATACANVFPDGAIPSAKLDSIPSSLETVTADPGNGAALPANLTTSIAITTAGAETNTLANPSAVGKVLSLTSELISGGARVITVASTINQSGNTIITLNTSGDNIILVAVQIVGAPRWRVLVNNGAALQ